MLFRTGDHLNELLKNRAEVWGKKIRNRLLTSQFSKFFLRRILGHFNFTDLGTNTSVFVFSTWLIQQHNVRSVATKPVSTNLGNLQIFVLNSKWTTFFFGKVLSHRIQKLIHFSQTGFLSKTKKMGGFYLASSLRWHLWMGLKRDNLCEYAAITAWFIEMVFCFIVKISF